MRYYLGAFLILQSSIAYSSDWVELTTSSEGAVWHADVKSIKDVPDGYNQQARKVWIKIDYSNVAKEKAREAKVLFFFDCAGERIKSTTWVQYKADGTVLDDISSTYPVYRNAIPDSIGGYVMNLICGVDLENKL